MTILNSAHLDVPSSRCFSLHFLQISSSLSLSLFSPLLSSSSKSHSFSFRFPARNPASSSNRHALTPPTTRFVTATDARPENPFSFVSLDMACFGCSRQRFEDNKCEVLPALDSVSTRLPFGTRTKMYQKRLWNGKSVS